MTAIEGTGLLPSQFDICDQEDDMSVLLAYQMVRSKMIAFERIENEKEAKRNRKRKGLFRRR